jgi:hypothetical protein
MQNDWAFHLTLNAMQQVRLQSGAIEYVPDATEQAIIDESAGKTDADYTQAELNALTLRLARDARIIK